MSRSHALIALGSNLGDSGTTLRAAVAQISAMSGSEILRVSRLFATTPVGGPDQPDFLNAAALITTQLSAADLLEKLHEIENHHGRVRDIRWGPRTLDLDLIDVEGFSSDSADLLVPHPRACERQFVLQPLCDVAPNWQIAGASVSSLVTASEEVRVVEDFGWSGV